MQVPSNVLKNIHMLMQERKKSVSVILTRATKMSRPNKMARTKEMAIVKKNEVITRNEAGLGKYFIMKINTDRFWQRTSLTPNLVQI